MITTPELIESLAANATPVRRLRPPAMRAVWWLLFAAIVLVLIGIGRGVRTDFGQRVQESMFVLGIAASLMTGAFAAVGAFMISLPDRSRLWLALPAPALVVWLATIGYRCATAWVELGPAGIVIVDEADCFATLLLTSVPISIAMLVMLRYAAPLRPAAVSMTGSLAISAFAATGLLLFHNIEATILILVWNVGVAVLFIGLGGIGGRMLLARVAPSPLPQRR